MKDLTFIESLTVKDFKEYCGSDTLEVGKTKNQKDAFECGSITGPCAVDVRTTPIEDIRVSKVEGPDDQGVMKEFWLIHKAPKLFVGEVVTL